MSRYSTTGTTMDTIGKSSAKGRSHMIHGSKHVVNDELSSTGQMPLSE